MMNKTIIPTRIIEFPQQMRELEVEDRISTQKMLERMLNSKINPDLQDEIVILKQGNNIITITMNNQEDIFEKSYKVLDNGGLQDINSKTISTLNPKYLIYKIKLR